MELVLGSGHFIMGGLGGFPLGWHAIGIGSFLVLVLVPGFCSSNFHFHFSQCVVFVVVISIRIFATSRHVEHGQGTVARTRALPRPEAKI